MLSGRGGSGVSSVLSAAELIELAKGIEKRGVAFYDVMSRSASEALTREVFDYLTGMERQHIVIFEGMLTKADRSKPAGVRPKEEADYLQALMENAVFTGDLAASEMAGSVSSDLDAIELAIGAEKDSIIFYYEMRDRMKTTAQTTLERVISEEKGHLQRLSELRERMLAGKSDEP
jgi:rubrerythrin